MKQEAHFNTRKLITDPKELEAIEELSQAIFKNVDPKKIERIVNGPTETKAPSIRTGRQPAAAPLPGPPNTPPAP